MQHIELDSRFYIKKTKRFTSTYVMLIGNQNSVSDQKNRKNSPQCLNHSFYKALKRLRHSSDSMSYFPKAVHLIINKLEIKYLFSVIGQGHGAY